MSAEVALRMRPVVAGVIDVGSNTIRLLVAGSARRGLDTILSERAHVGLAADVERQGKISDARLRRVHAVAARYAVLARECGVDRLEVVITAPGRQSANAAALHEQLADATSAPIRQLSAEDEGRLAYAGAVGACRTVPETIAVVDVGGGSTQIMVGTEEGPAWLRPLELGSLRLTERVLEADPPTQEELDVLAGVARQAFEGLTPPLPISALATGGTARTLRRTAGRRLGEENLTEALRTFTAKPAKELAAEYGIPRARARVMPAGAILLREAHRRLGVKLEVARGGVREGALRAMLAELAAEAA
jgi:exopolyphosphatase/guanosine-5'-triphosphate,3'-diphosphate pyrophosphatase